MIARDKEGTKAEGVQKCLANNRELELSFVCRGGLLGQNFASSGCVRSPLQDEDHPGSRPHSLPGLYQIRSGTSERFRSGPGSADS